MGRRHLGDAQQEVVQQHALVLVECPEGPLVVLIGQPGDPLQTRRPLVVRRMACTRRSLHLAEARDEMPATVSVTTQMLHGRPTRAIAALAESGGYDRVVTGPRPRGRLGRLLHHSVTHGLLSRTRASVLAVTPH